MNVAALDPSVSDGQRIAHEAGLVYVSDGLPGIARRRRGKGFSYYGPDGGRIVDRATLGRLRGLAVPPAWTDVWLCPVARGHIQATGRDARGRKQYRYHLRWREVRDETKYHRMVAFGRALPAIRARVSADMARRGLPREKVLATVVRLLETSLIRVGNRAYARENKSFGLTTLRNRHARIAGSEIRFRFRAKGGVDREVTLRDRRLARVVKACHDLPGQDLFQYLDASGERHPIGSADVNGSLQDVTGVDFTAKDFRTWAGTVLAAFALQEFEAFDSEAAAKRNLTQAITAVASRLGNTVAICRKCYVHPEIVAAYLDGTLLDMVVRRIEADLAGPILGLTGEEAAVLAFLEARLRREAAARGRASVRRRPEGAPPSPRRSAGGPHRRGSRRAAG
ncbi:MAG: DNA topoisomerase IB [Alphaproteobacteria bacterium]